MVHQSCIIRFTSVTLETSCPFPSSGLFGWMLSVTGGTTEEHNLPENVISVSPVSGLRAEFNKSAGN